MYAKWYAFWSMLLAVCGIISKNAHTRNNELTLVGNGECYFSAVYVKQFENQKGAWPVLSGSLCDRIYFWKDDMWSFNNMQFLGPRLYIMIQELNLYLNRLYMYICIFELDKFPANSQFGRWLTLLYLLVMPVSLCCPSLFLLTGRAT